MEFSLLAELLPNIQLVQLVKLVQLVQLNIQVFQANDISTSNNRKEYPPFPIVSVIVYDLPSWLGLW